MSPYVPTPPEGHPLSETSAAVLGNIERPFYEFLSKASLFTLVLDGHGKVLFANEALCALLGWKKSELEGSDWFDRCMPPDGAWMRGALYDAILEDTIAARWENDLVTRSGERRTIQWDNLPISSKDGQVIGVAALGRDVSNERAEESALAERERRFRALIDSSTDAVVITGAGGRVMFANQALETITGYTADEMLGRDLRSIYAAEEMPHSNATLATLREKPGNTSRTRRRIRHKSGAERIIEIFSVNRSDDPAINGIVATIRNITNELTLQAELAQAQKMEALGRLAGGIAHDFNNVLTVISTNAELALSVVPRFTPGHEELNEILKASAKAARFSRQLLTFSRRRAASPEVADLNEIVNESRELFGRAIPENIEFVVHSSRDALLTRVEPGQVEQILTNLVVNARDAMPQGGRITLTTSRSSLPGANAGAASTPAALLSVKDDGVGMSADTRARAFDPFFTTKSVGEGSGIGLAVVYSIVSQLGGQVRLDSTPGEGAKVSVLLPLIDEIDLDRDSAGLATVKPTRGARVLLVEDEDTLRRVVRRMLESDGFEVIEARNGHEGLDAFRVAGDVQLVISDMVMPGMGGAELARELRKLRPELPILFVSGYAPEHVSAEAVPMQNTSLIQKPFTMDQLLIGARSLLADRALE